MRRTGAVRCAIAVLAFVVSARAQEDVGKPDLAAELALLQEGWKTDADAFNKRFGTGEAGAESHKPLPEADADPRVVVVRY